MKIVRPLALLAAVALTSCVGLALPMLTGCSRAEQAPALAYTLLDGRKSDLAALRGHVVLVNFWTTDCAPCVEEMPAMVANWRRYAPQGFQTLAVSMRYDPPALVANFAEARALPFGVVIDNTGEIARQLGNVQFTPTSLLINKRGEIVRRWVGKTNFSEVGPMIEALQGETWRPTP
jgi:peroxiredoxin